MILNIMEGETIWEFRVSENKNEDTNNIIKTIVKEKLDIEEDQSDITDLTE